MDIRNVLKDAIALRDKLDLNIAMYKEEYKATHTNLVYITDHAMLRYAERIEGYIVDWTKPEDELHRIYNGNITAKREALLTRYEQEFIIDKNLKNYNQHSQIHGDLTFIIKNLAVVTIFIRNNSKTT